MKRNLILSLIACGASLALCPGLHAQEASPAPATSGTDAGTGGHQWGHRGGGESLERLTKELTLTTDQQAQIKPILDTLHTTMQANMQDTTLTQQEKMAKNKDTRNAANTQINALLTPDQQTKFAAMLQNMHNHRHGGDNSQSAVSPAATP